MNQERVIDKKVIKGPRCKFQYCDRDEARPKVADILLLSTGNSKSDAALQQRKKITRQRKA